VTWLFFWKTAAAFFLLVCCTWN